MLRLPAAKAEVVNAAWLLPFSVPLPMLAMPFLNVTVPLAGGDTVAVNVTGSPTLDGFKLELKAVVELALSMVCSKGADVAAA